MEEGLGDVNAVSAKNNYRIFCGKTSGLVAMVIRISHHVHNVA